MFTPLNGATATERRLFVVSFVDHFWEHFHAVMVVPAFFLKRKNYIDENSLLLCDIEKWF